MHMEAQKYNIKYYKNNMKYINLENNSKYGNLYQKKNIRMISFDTNS